MAVSACALGVAVERSKGGADGTVARGAGGEGRLRPDCLLGGLCTSIWPSCSCCYGLLHAGVRVCERALHLPRYIFSMGMASGAGCVLVFGVV